MVNDKNGLRDADIKCGDEAQRGGKNQHDIQAGKTGETKKDGESQDGKTKDGEPQGDGKTQAQHDDKMQNSQGSSETQSRAKPTSTDIDEFTSVDSRSTGTKGEPATSKKERARLRKIIDVSTQLILSYLSQSY